MHTADENRAAAIASAWLAGEELLRAVEQFVELHGRTLIELTEEIDNCYPDGLTDEDCRRYDEATEASGLRAMREPLLGAAEALSALLNGAPR